MAKENANTLQPKGFVTEVTTVPSGTTPRRKPLQDLPARKALPKEEAEKQGGQRGVVLHPKEEERKVKEKGKEKARVAAQADQPALKASNLPALEVEKGMPQPRAANSRLPPRVEESPPRAKQTGLYASIS